MADVAVIVPVTGRPQNAEPFMFHLRNSLHGLARTATAYAVCDVGDDDTTEAWRAAGAEVLVRARQDKRPGTFAEKVNHAYRRTTEPWLFLTGDDVKFHLGWLNTALQVAEHTGARVVGTNDLGNARVYAGDHATHMLVARSYADETGASWDGPGVVAHEGYRHWYCNPPEAPIWMGDLSFRPIGEVRVGDEIVGFERRQAPQAKFSLNRLTRARVEAIRVRESPIVRVTMESGRTFRCTPDHRWLNATWTPAAEKRWADYPQWVTPKVGRQLLHVADDPGPVPAGLERVAGWVGGIYDGEGSWIQIAQSPEHNPEVWAAIGEALNKLDIPHTAGGPTNGGHFYTLTGGRQAYLKFLNWCQPVKRHAIADRLIGGGARFGQRDRIVSVEPDGYGEVISMTTTTGNYVAWGYASRNCDDEIVTAAKQRGTWAPARGAVVEHMHPAFGKAPNDYVYLLGQSQADRDEELFKRRLAEHS